MLHELLPTRDGLSEFDGFDQSDATMFINAFCTAWTYFLCNCALRFMIVLCIKIIIIIKIIRFIKRLKYLASEALTAGQRWVLIKSFTEKVRLKPRFKYRQWDSADYCSRQLAQNNERLVSRSLSWWTACPVLMGRQRSEVSVHWLQSWCGDWGMSVLWRCCDSWKSTQQPCTRFCVDCVTNAAHAVCEIKQYY